MKFVLCPAGKCSGKIKKAPFSELTQTEQKVGYFLVESVVFLVLSTVMVWVVSVPDIVMVSFFTTEVESVVVVEVPDPQAAKLDTIIRIANFFMM